MAGFCRPFFAPEAGLAEMIFSISVAPSLIRKFLNADATGGNRLFLRCTTYQFNITGKFSTSSTTRLPACSSRLMVWADRKPTPMPAITACLMVSVLLISIAIFRSCRWRPKPSSIEFQVSDPFSRTTKGSRFKTDIGIFFLPASGWSGGATMT